jgi:hypothetical protein
MTGPCSVPPLRPRIPSSYLYLTWRNSLTKQTRMHHSLISMTLKTRSEYPP